MIKSRNVTIVIDPSFTSFVGVIIADDVGTYSVQSTIHCNTTSCSDNFLSGQLFSVQAEKQVRFCGRCYDHLSRVLKAQGYTVDDQLSGRGASEQLSRSLTDVQEQPILISSKSVNLPKSPTKERDSEPAHSEHDTEFNPDIE